MQTKDKGLLKNQEEHNEWGPSAQQSGQDQGLTVPPALWAQDPPPWQGAAGLKELRVHPRLGTVINDDMTNDGQSFAEA